MGSLALGVGALLVFALTLPVFQSSEGEAPGPVVVGGLVPTQSTDAPATQQGAGGPVSTGVMVPRPTSVEELVVRADVIALGTISSVLEEKWIGPYGDDGKLLPADEDGLPFTDYLLQIDSVLKGDGTVTDRGSLVLRMFGHLSNQDAIITPDLFTLPNPGDHLLFALGRNPDGTYGSGPQGLLSVDGDRVAYADGVPFSVAISPEQLIQEIREALARTSTMAAPQGAGLTGLALASEEGAPIRDELVALDPLSLPEAAVPMDLGGARLPGDADSIVSLFNRLPGELAGRERTPRLDETGPSRFTAAYGQLTEDGCSSVRLQAVDLSSREFFPADWTADRFVAWWGLGADGDTVGQPPYTHSNLIPRLYHHRMTQILTPHTGSEFFKVSPSAPTGQIFETRQLTVQHFPPQWAHT